MTTSYNLELTEMELFLLIGLLVGMNQAELTPAVLELLSKLRCLAEGK